MGWLIVVKLVLLHTFIIASEMHISPPPACRALVDEMEWAISQIDPKKMIQTGSFRINPDGSQSVREVTYFCFIMTLALSWLFSFLFFFYTNLEAFSILYYYNVVLMSSGSLFSLWGSPAWTDGRGLWEDEWLRRTCWPCHQSKDIRETHVPWRHRHGPFWCGLWLQSQLQLKVCCKIHSFISLRLYF